MPDRILLTPEPLDPVGLGRSLAGVEDGAVVTFAGNVRRQEGDVALRGIDYQAYAGMAERAIAAIFESAHARWPRFSAVVAHRTGVVPVGETSVWIAVAAGHRAEAFEVARHLIDEVKASVPIWKREHLPEEPSGPPGVDTKQGVE